MSDKIEFRQEALEGLSLAERYDSSVQIIPPSSWMLLVTLGVLLASFVAWSLWGTVSYTVTSQGLLLREGEVFDVLATGGGQLLEVKVKEGEIVQAGQVVGLIDQPDIDKALQMLEEDLGDLKRKAEELSRLDQKNLELKKNYYRGRAGGVGRAMEDKEKQLRLLEDKKQTQEELLRKGLIAKTALLETNQQLLSLKEELNNRRSELRDLSAQEMTAFRGVEEQRWLLEQQISDKQREIERTQKRQEVSSQVLSKAAGRVVEVKLRSGDYVQAGDSLLTLESLELRPESLEVVTYLPVADGKRVHPGMELRVVPSFVKVEEDGFVLGQVTSTSMYPVSMQSILRVTRNAKLAESLLSGGPVYEIRGRLMLDPQTTSGFKWSTHKGRDYPIQSGTYCTGLVTVKRLRPYELVLPAIRSTLGQSIPSVESP
jgi:HlyD family secretion protein